MAKATADINQQIADALGVVIVDEKEFTRRVNEAMVNLIIPRLQKAQMEIDGVIKPKEA